MSTPSILQYKVNSVEAVAYSAAYLNADTTPGSTLFAIVSYGGVSSVSAVYETPTGWTQIGEQVNCVDSSYGYKVAAAAFAFPTVASYAAGHEFFFNLSTAPDQADITLLEISQAGPPSAFQFNAAIFNTLGYDFSAPALTPAAPENIPITGLIWIPNNANLIESPPGYTSYGAFVINLQEHEMFYGGYTSLAPVGPFAFAVDYPSIALAVTALIPPSPNLNQLDAHLSISPAKLVLIPPDATLPFNQTLLYKVRKVYGTGYSAIPTGIFLSTAGTMDPPGVTSTGQAVLTPYEDTIGPYTVTFVETGPPVVPA